MVWIDPDFPKLLGQELYRPDSKYIAKMVTRPRVVHEFFKTAGDTVQLDRYNYWDTGRDVTKEDRERSDTQTIGVSNARRITKDKVIMYLREYTGPASEQDASMPGTFQIPLKQIMTAQRNLWEYGQRAFHDSIGSSNLLQDFRRWEDRSYINELLKTTNIYNPVGVADGGTYDLSSNDYGGRPPKFDVDDQEQIVADLMARNAPTFEDGNYACICTPYFLKDLRKDKDFMEVSRYPGAIPVEQMTVGAGSMQPAQIPFVNSPWAGGLGAGQAKDMGGMSLMPTGFVFDGVRFFVTNNLPKASVTLTYSNQAAGVTGGAAVRSGEIGIFFGPEAIGVGIGGAGPQILLNSNTDFDRFVIAIWQMFGGFELLDERFVTVARSYQS